MKPTHENFIIESNKIEGILRPPTAEERAEFTRFMTLPAVKLADLQQFVSIYQPNAMLRDRAGLNVRVGHHIPPFGGPKIRLQLEAILENLFANTPHSNHVAYETLHPFTDGNGRSGRMLWAWQMKSFPLGFLHHFYYQTLAESARRPLFGQHGTPAFMVRVRHGIHGSVSG